MNFVKGSIPEYMIEYPYPFNKEDSLLKEEVDDALISFDTYNEKRNQILLEASLEGIDPEDFDKLYMLEAEEGGTVFAKIGGAVRKVVESIIKFFKDMIDKLKSVSFKSKSDIAKLEAMCKAHPELKDKIIAHEGDFDLSAAKSLADLDKQYNEIMEMCKRHDNPKSIRTKLSRFKEHLRENKGTIGAVGAGIGLAAAIVALKKNLNECADSCAKRKARWDQYKDSGIAAAGNDPTYSRLVLETNAAMAACEKKYCWQQIGPLMRIARAISDHVGGAADINAFRRSNAQSLPRDFK